MRKGRFTEEQIIKVLKEHAVGMSAGDVCRKHGISDATFYKWRSRYGGMIMRAIERGVQEAKIAKALNVNLEYIKRRKGLLRHICPEVVHALKQQEINPVTFDVLRKMKPKRQIEACQLMTSAGNYSSAYAKALLAASRDIDLKDPLGRRPAGPMTCADLALMERELKTVQGDFRAIESSYGEDVLQLIVASSYLSRLISNRRIFCYLNENHPEILAKFQSVVSATSVESDTR